MFNASVCIKISIHKEVIVLINIDSNETCEFHGLKSETICSTMNVKMFLGTAVCTPRVCLICCSVAAVELNCVRTCL